MANEYLDKAGLSAVWEKIVDKINNSLVDNDYMTVVSANEISTESNINDNNIPTTSAVKKLIDTELENVPTDSFKNDAIKGGSSGTSASIYGGKKSFATGDCSLAVGNGVSATGTGSVALGEGATLNGKLCAAGRDSIVAGHAFRSGIISATGETSIAIGKAGTDKASVVAGNTGSIAIGTIEVVDGPDTIAANGQAALAMGYIIDSDDGGDVFTTSSGSIVANGRGSMARGMVFGGDIISESDGSHAEGYVKAGGYIQAIGNGAVAIGVANEKSLIASGEASVAIGLNTSATGKAAHAEGEETLAAAGGAHAEGVGTTAYYGSHAEGFATLASGVGAHAGGQSILPQQAGYTSAIGNGAFAHGQGAKALANNSVAFGDHTTSNAANCTVFGKYNATTNAPFVVGWGDSYNNKKDLFKVDTDNYLNIARFNADPNEDFTHDYLATTIDAIDRDSEASSCKDFWEDMEDGVRCVYNNKGTEYTLLFSKSSNDNKTESWGTILRWSYSSTNIEILRYQKNKWNDEDWSCIGGNASSSDSYSCSLGSESNKCIKLFHTTNPVNTGNSSRNLMFSYTVRDANNNFDAGIGYLEYESTLKDIIRCVPIGSNRTTLKNIIKYEKETDSDGKYKFHIYADTGVSSSISFRILSSSISYSIDNFTQNKPQNWIDCTQNYNKYIHDASFFSDRTPTAVIGLNWEDTGLKGVYPSATTDNYKENGNFYSKYLAAWVKTDRDTAGTDYQIKDVEAQKVTVGSACSATYCNGYQIKVYDAGSEVPNYQPYEIAFVRAY